MVCSTVEEFKSCDQCSKWNLFPHSQHLYAITQSSRDEIYIFIWSRKPAVVLVKIWSVNLNTYISSYWAACPSTSTWADVYSVENWETTVLFRTRQVDNSNLAVQQSLTSKCYSYTREILPTLETGLNTAHVLRLHSSYVELYGWGLLDISTARYVYKVSKTILHKHAANSGINMFYDKCVYK